MSTRMLFTERYAYARMGQWRPVHRALRAAYFAACDRTKVFYPLWRLYRRTWPKWTPS